MPSEQTSPNPTPKDPQPGPETSGPEREDAHARPSSQSIVTKSHPGKVDPRKSSVGSPGGHTEGDPDTHLRPKDHHQTPGQGSDHIAQHYGTQKSSTSQEAQPIPEMPDASLAPLFGVSKVPATVISSMGIMPRQPSPSQDSLGKPPHEGRSLSQHASTPRSKSQSSTAMAPPKMNRNYQTPDAQPHTAWLGEKMESLNGGDRTSMRRFSETSADKSVGEIQCLEALREYAARRGADLKSITEARSPSDESVTFRDTDKEQVSPVSDEKGKEAVLALYAYPKINNTGDYFPCVPQSRKDEIDRAREDLRNMEKRFRSATRQQITAASESLEGSPPPETPEQVYLALGKPWGLTKPHPTGSASAKE